MSEREGRIAGKEKTEYQQLQHELRKRKNERGEKSTVERGEERTAEREEKEGGERKCMGISMVTKRERQKRRERKYERQKRVRVIPTHSMQHSEWGRGGRKNTFKRGREEKEIEETQREKLEEREESESDGFGSLLDFLERERIII